MSKHTPGPWIYDEHAAKIVVADNHFNPVVQVPVAWDNAEANARLIAAAPELLESLKRILHNYVDARDQADPDVLEARAAVAKAEGREP